MLADLALAAQAERENVTTYFLTKHLPEREAKQRHQAVNRALRTLREWTEAV